ncbi:MAG TPA: SDR family oxidoreductase [Streptosporangiaceae bacterium]|nr:SDR family oxidoreductase [Streptosporangiaceae bacterium]
MPLPILVTGGTGTLGQQVVARLRAAGLDVRILSRRTGDGLVTGDLATGQGLAAAVQHGGTIVHCASNRKGDAQATRNLVQAATQAATQPGEPQPHLVYISIVGVDRFPRGYFKAKLEAERVVAESGLPWTTLRATQFYELIAKGATRLAKLPVIPVPADFVVQPVDSGEVAARLAELALGEPSGRVPDMAGPQILSFGDLIRTYLRVTGVRPRPVVSVWTPGIGAIRAGALYPPPGAQTTLGQRTWPDFLTSTTREVFRGV